MYAAVVDGKVAVKLGPGSWSPTDAKVPVANGRTDWALVTSGNDFAVRSTAQDPSASIFCSPLRRMLPVRSVAKAVAKAASGKGSGLRRGSTQYERHGLVQFLITVQHVQRLPVHSFQMSR